MATPQKVELCAGYMRRSGCAGNVRRSGLPVARIVYFTSLSDLFWMCPRRYLDQAMLSLCTFFAPASLFLFHWDYFNAVFRQEMGITFFMQIRRVAIFSYISVIASTLICKKRNFSKVVCLYWWAWFRPLALDFSLAFSLIRVPPHYITRMFTSMRFGFVLTWSIPFQIFDFLTVVVSYGSQHRLRDWKFSLLYMLHVMFFVNQSNKNMSPWCVSAIGFCFLQEVSRDHRNFLPAISAVLMHVLWSQYMHLLWS